MGGVIALAMIWIAGAAWSVNGAVRLSLTGCPMAPLWKHFLVGVVTWPLEAIVALILLLDRIRR